MRRIMAGVYLTPSANIPAMRNLMMALVCASLASGAELAARKALTLSAAKQMAAAAETEARKNNWNVVIVIVDEGGHLIYLQRMDETQIASVEIAQGKARTAVLYKRPTKAMEDAVAGGRNVVMTLPGALPVEGGVPVTVEGRIIGAIGVSGVQSSQDAQIARAGLAVLETK
jgi:glc operon protein GlcG